MKPDIVHKVVVVIVNVSFDVLFVIVEQVSASCLFLVEGLFSNWAKPMKRRWSNPNNNKGKPVALIVILVMLTRMRMMMTCWQTGSGEARLLLEVFLNPDTADAADAIDIFTNHKH